jgi:hypothetical protein
MHSIIGNNRRKVSARWNWKMNVNQALGLYSIMEGAGGVGGVKVGDSRGKSAA